MGDAHSHSHSHSHSTRVSRRIVAHSRPNEGFREHYVRDDVDYDAFALSRVDKRTNEERERARLRVAVCAIDVVKTYSDALTLCASEFVFVLARSRVDALAMRSECANDRALVRKIRSTFTSNGARAFVEMDDAHVSEVVRAIGAIDANDDDRRGREGERTKETWTRERAIASVIARSRGDGEDVVVVSCAMARERERRGANANAMPVKTTCASASTFAREYVTSAEGKKAFEDAFDANEATREEDEGASEDGGGDDDDDDDDDARRGKRNASRTWKTSSAFEPYEPHRSASAIEQGVATGEFARGALVVTKLGVKCEGFVTCANARVLISSKRAMNRAIHGDVVAVRVDARALEEEANGRTGVDDGESAALARFPASTFACAGSVVGIIERKVRDVVACLDAEDEEDIARDPRAKRSSALCVPMDAKIVKVKILTRRARELVGARFVVRIDGWQTHQRYPAGRLVKILGPAGDVDVEMAALLARFDIPSEPFGQSALAELPREGANWVVPPSEVDARRDLRHHRACSIDPPGCTDVDDALSVYALPERNPSNGGVYEVGVHIADVSYFVREGSALDFEARARGTTVYLVNRRLDMLPALLSENLASLLENRDRLAVSCVWTLNEHLDIVDVWFGRTVIRSRHQMTYYQAQAIHDERPAPEGEPSFDAAETTAVREDLRTLVVFANRVNNIRVAHGAVELESAELRFETDAQTQSPTEVLRKQEVPMMRVVAELMILANSAVARATHQTFPGCTLLRRHAPPREDGFQELARLASARGVALDCSSGEALNASLARVASSADADVTTLFKGLATRAMSEAQYVSSGSTSSVEGGFGHYGLALTYYTHFTSPIRRYADVIVHRQLIAAVEARAHVGSNASLESIATHLNERNRASKHAQSRCGEIYLLWLLREKPMIEPAIIHEVRDDGVLVFLPSFHIKAPIKFLDENGDVIEELRVSEFVATDGDDGAKWLEAAPSVGVAGATTRRRVVASGCDVLDVVRDGQVVRSYSLLQKLWVQLSCKQSRTHGPRLELRALDAERHSGAREAAERRAEMKYPSTAPAPAMSLSHVMRQIIAGKSSSIDDDRDAELADKLNVPAKRSRRWTPLAEPLARLDLNLDPAPLDPRVVIDDERTCLWVPRTKRALARAKSLAIRRKTARAWARCFATRPFGALGRARFHRRLARFERLRDDAERVRA